MLWAVFLGGRCGAGLGGGEAELRGDGDALYVLLLPVDLRFVPRLVETLSSGREAWWLIGGGFWTRASCGDGNNGPVMVSGNAAESPKGTLSSGMAGAARSMGSIEGLAEGMEVRMGESSKESVLKMSGDERESNEVQSLLFSKVGDARDSELKSVGKQSKGVKSADGE